MLRRIRVGVTLEPSQGAKTLAYELALMELEAESVAFVVCDAFSQCHENRAYYQASAERVPDGASPIQVNRFSTQLQELLTKLACYLVELGLRQSMERKQTGTAPGRWCDSYRTLRDVSHPHP